MFNDDIRKTGNLFINNNQNSQNYNHNNSQNHNHNARNHNNPHLNEQQNNNIISHFSGVEQSRKEVGKTNLCPFFGELEGGKLRCWCSICSHICSGGRGNP